MAYQRGRDLRLESLLSSRPDLERHLASLLSSSRPLLSIARSDSSLLLSSASSPSPSPSPSPPAAAGRPDFVGCLTSLFKDIVLAVQENDETLRELCSALRRGRCRLHHL
ncbi:Conserved oligomeric Golgi complex subunit 4 [Ananas comosus]|uniref:Conserved oligomeric Golgi complex subunit 4 n=1 Tax=Ananas comosus TaxID=4615 RepID=A0A199ULV8_ANACO|nr:Conserved oligomeric Golgi complex subunit 4 [Ananas comosus]